MNKELHWVMELRTVLLRPPHTLDDIIRHHKMHLLQTAVMKHGEHEDMHYN
jgi:hypothetical protein